MNRTKGSGIASRGLVAFVAIVVLLGYSARQLWAAALSTGDIAIIGFNFDDPDQFAFVALRDLDAGEVINFTDNGWFASGSFRTGEGTGAYTVAGGGLSAGSIVAGPVGGMQFSTSGDSIIAYQGLASSPTIVYAMNSEGPGNWQADATSSNTSSLPSKLIDSFTAPSFTEIDNGVFNTAALSSGNKNQWLHAIARPANWTFNDTTPQVMPTGSISITAAPNPGALPVAWSFTGAAGTEASLPPDALPAELLVSEVSRGVGISPAAAANAFSADSFGTAVTPDLDEYFSFGIATDADRIMTLTKIELDERRSGTGIRTWSVRSSLDGFTSDLAVFNVPDDTNTRTDQTINLSPQFSHLTGGVEFRVYGYAAEAGTGTWRIDNLQIFGSVFPEPSSAIGMIALVGLSALRLRLRSRGRVRG